MVVAQATRKLTTSRFLDHLNGPDRPVLVFDGATGTSLQDLDLNADDFGGVELEGCNENLVVTSPESVKAVHRHRVGEGLCVLEVGSSAGGSPRRRCPSTVGVHRPRRCCRFSRP